MTPSHSGSADALVTGATIRPPPTSMVSTTSRRIIVRPSVIWGHRYLGHRLMSEPTEAALLVFSTDERRIALPRTPHPRPILTTRTAAAWDHDEVRRRGSPVVRRTHGPDPQRRALVRHRRA